MKGDGEADIGDEDGDNNEGVFFRLLFKGITFPSLRELCNVSIFLLLYWWIGVPSFLTILSPCCSSSFLSVL